MVDINVFVFFFSIFVVIFLCLFYRVERKYIAVLSLLLTLILYVVFFLLKISKSKESFWDISPAARCKGGEYMWQGDSEKAKMCREMAASEEGRCAIASYNCPTGYVGQPKIPFYYTPLSDENWKNEQCSDDIPSCNCSDNVDSLCSMERRVPYDVSCNN